MYNVPYQLYAVNKATGAMTKLKEGTRAQMGREMNAVRHSAPKDSRYSIFCGNRLVSATFN